SAPKTSPTKIDARPIARTWPGVNSEIREARYRTETRPSSTPNNRAICKASEPRSKWAMRRAPTPRIRNAAHLRYLKTMIETNPADSAGRGVFASAASMGRGVSHIEFALQTHDARAGRSPGQFRSPRPSGRGGHGRGLQGPRHTPGARGRAEGPAGVARGGQGTAVAIRAGGARGVGAQPSQHRLDLRDRPGR